MNIENLSKEKYSVICDNCRKTFLINYPKNGEIIICECGKKKIMEIEEKKIILGANDYIGFIEKEKYDLITPVGLKIIAKEFLIIKKRLKKAEDTISRINFPDNTGR